MPKAPTKKKAPAPKKGKAKEPAKGKTAKKKAAPPPPAKPPEVRGLVLSLITADPALQPRVGGSPDEVIEEYAEAVRGGAEFPPLVVYEEAAEDAEGGPKWWLSEGFTRHAAYQRAGKVMALCEVRPGTRQDALVNSCGSNRAHGLRRTNADKRRAVGLLLAEFPKWSDRKVADAAGVYHQLVADVRANGVVPAPKPEPVPEPKAAGTWTLQTWDGVPNFPSDAAQFLAEKGIDGVADLDSHRDKIRKQKGRQNADRYDALRDLGTPHTFAAGDALVEWEQARAAAPSLPASPAPAQPAPKVDPPKAAPVQPDQPADATLFDNPPADQLGTLLVGPLAKLVPVFEAREAVRLANQTCGSLVDELRTLDRDYPIGGFLPRRPRLIRDIDRIADVLRTEVAPYCVCPDCGADGSDCPACGGKGWLTRAAERTGGLDAEGVPIPARLRDDFANFELREDVRDLERIAFQMRELSSALPWLKPEAHAALADAARLVADAVPYAVCVACGGAGCGRCLTSGYHPKWSHDAGQNTPPGGKDGAP